MLKLDTLEESSEQLILKLSGPLTCKTIGSIWNRAFEQVSAPNISKLILDCSAVNACDATGVTLLLELKKKQTAADKAFEIRALPKDYERLLSTFDKEGKTAEQKMPKPHRGFVEETGYEFVQIFHGIKFQIGFIGELV